MFGVIYICEDCDCTWEFYYNGGVCAICGGKLKIVPDEGRKG